MFNSVNVCKSGVEPNSDRIQTKEIQAVIDSMKDSGGTVYFPKGRYVTGTLYLYSDITVYMESGAELLGSGCEENYEGNYMGAVEAPSFSKCLIYAENTRNVTIKGNGCIDGRSVTFKNARPMLMRFVNCSDLKFENVHIKNAGAWAVHFVRCENIHISGVTLFSRSVSNSDGFDFDSCRDVFISNTKISTGDDSICLKNTTEIPCENFVISNCILSSDTAGLKIGTSSVTGFKNIVMSNCIFKDCPMGTIKIISVDGALIENIRISDIVMENVGSPLFIRIGRRNMKFDKPIEMDYETAGRENDEKPGKIRNISISGIIADVTAEKDRAPLMLTGIKDSCIENVRIRNMYVSFPGGGNNEDSCTVVPEDEFRYPEQSFFGVLPAWGMYARHIRGLSLEDVEFVLKSEDMRCCIVKEDCE